MNHGHENDQSAWSKVRWPMSCTICLVNKIYHEVVLRLRSSGSVLERDEGKTNTLFYSNFPKWLRHIFLAKLTLKLSNMSVISILCCIRRHLVCKRVVPQQWSWWNDWRDYDTKYRNSFVPSGLIRRNPNETIIKKSIRPNFSVSFAPEARRGCLFCKRKLSNNSFAKEQRRCRSLRASLCFSSWPWISSSFLSQLFGNNLN